MVADTSQTGRRHGRRARAAQDETNEQVVHSTTGDLAFFAKRLPLPLPPANSPIPEIKRFDVLPLAQILPGTVAPDLSEPQVAAEPAAEVEDVNEWVVTDPETELPNAEVGSRKNAWFAPEVFAKPDQLELAEEAETQVFEPVTDLDTEEHPVVESQSVVEEQPAAGEQPAVEEFGPESSSTTDWVEAGELSAENAPEPIPAPRFDGKVLNKPSRTAGGIGVWIAWLLLALVVIALIWLVVNGTIGPGLVNSAPEEKFFSINSIFIA